VKERRNDRWEEEGYERYGFVFGLSGPRGAFASCVSTNSFLDSTW